MTVAYPGFSLETRDDFGEVDALADEDRDSPGFFAAGREWAGLDGLNEGADFGGDALAMAAAEIGG
jgi:hypothetical protein